MANPNNPSNPNRQDQQGGQHGGREGGQQRQPEKEVGSGRDRERMPDEDLSRKQREGNLGNERNRSSESDRPMPDRSHDSSRFPE
jgi:hypothetical protein